MLVVTSPDLPELVVADTSRMAVGDHAGMPPQDLEGARRDRLSVAVVTPAVGAVVIDGARVMPARAQESWTAHRGEVALSEAVRTPATVDAVVVAASARAAGEQGLAMVGRAGRLVFYASLHPRESLELDWNRIHYEEITIAGAEGNTERDFREAVALLAGGSVDLRPLISRVIDLEELPEELASKPAGDVQRVVVRL